MPRRKALILDNPECPDEIGTPMIEIREPHIQVDKNLPVPSCSKRATENVVSEDEDEDEFEDASEIMFDMGNRRGKDHDRSRGRGGGFGMDKGSYPVCAPLNFGPFKPREFDGKAWSEYHIYFQQLADLNGWDGKQRAMVLSLCLTGEAAQVLASLP